MKYAFITGITGQTGSYLADLLLSKQYIVYGMIRRSSSFNTKRIDHIFNKLKLFYGDLIDLSSLITIINKIKSNLNNDDILEVYNLGAQSHVRVSFDNPIYTTQVDAVGTLNILEAIRLSDITNVRFYQASTSEMFGKVQETPQTEITPFYPRSPYGVAKLYAYWITVNYREAYDIYACNGILFNHESERRGGTFVTRKITKAISKIQKGEQRYLTLGNLDSKRDWGYAPDYAEAIWLTLQQDKADDYLISTGETHTVREFVELAFKEVNIDIKWKGEDLDEVGYNDKNGDILVKIDPVYFRPTEVDLLLGDSTVSREKLGWQPKVQFKDLVKRMMLYDVKK